MTCRKCKKDMYIDDSGGTVAWGCWCGHREYPRLKTNAICDKCGERFIKKGRTKLCPDCRMLSKIKMPLPSQPCEQCKNEYVPRMRGTRFCSKSCQTSAAWQRKKPVKHCELCGDQIMGRGSKFCSAECRTIKWNTENDDSRKAAARKYYENNKEEHNARGCKRYADNKELRKDQAAAWEKANKASRNVYHRNYYQENIDHMRALDRLRYKRRKEMRASA